MITHGFSHPDCRQEVYEGFYARIFITQIVGKRFHECFHAGFFDYSRVFIPMFSVTHENINQVAGAFLIPVLLVCTEKGGSLIAM